jgi:hypothetical protein
MKNISKIFNELVCENQSKTNLSNKNAPFYSQNRLQRKLSRALTIRDVSLPRLRVVLPSSRITALETIFFLKTSQAFYWKKLVNQEIYTYVYQACSTVVIELRLVPKLASVTQVPRFEPGLFHKACYMPSSSWMKLTLSFFITYVCVGA